MSETDSIRWQAAQWIERRMGDDPFDQQAFDAWIAGDPHCQAAFEAMWRRVMGPDMDEALRTLRRRRPSKTTRLASGAAILLTMAGGYKAMPWIDLRLAQPEEYGAEEGSVREVALADGTRLTLAGGADVRVRYTANDRVVELKRGTIFANVVHDARRPFRVDAGSARIVDVGTSFEVLDRRAIIRVTVASGSVQFGSSGWFSRPIHLTENQAATLDETGLKRLADTSPASIARWRGEWVEYKGARLQQVIADLQSLSPLPIEIADAALADKRVSGRIRLTDPVGQLQNLSITHNFQVRRTPGALILSRN